jgi:hypothetical protein
MSGGIVAVDAIREPVRRGTEGEPKLPLDVLRFFAGLGECRRDRQPPV